MTIEVPELKDGEKYAGILLAADGTPAAHLIVLPARFDEGRWKDAMQWAKEQGGELPDRREAALVWANLGLGTDSFECDWYRTREENPSASDFAFFQSFSDGYSSWYHKDYDYRGFAVRRVII